MKPKLLNAIEYTLPAFWASYLIKHDASGISMIERAQVDSFLAYHKLPAPVACSDEAWFSSRNDSTIEFSGDVMDYVFLINQPTP